MRTMEAYPREEIMDTRESLEKATGKVLLTKFRLANVQIGIDQDQGKNDQELQEYQELIAYASNLEEELLIRLTVGASASELVRKFVT